jgi:hypothetical protein
LSCRPGPLLTLDFRGAASGLYMAVESFKVIAPALLYFNIPTVNSIIPILVSTGSHFRLHPAIGGCRQEHSLAIAVALDRAATRLARGERRGLGGAPSPFGRNCKPALGSKRTKLSKQGPKPPLRWHLIASYIELVYKQEAK